MNKNFKVIHSLQLMMHLVRNGFNVSKVTDAYPKQGEEKSKYKVFLFENTPELNECCLMFKK
ncbi:DUF5659 domain-containing protein [Anaerotignum propionicum]|uniref:DUF5659 domain-containing protein n=1 Tax=Anaerotignum propionicum DSM 1682 TaxID=991789 RepID=A0A0X8VES4_ANAPI|nr:DUF5659 domain-containing protein [Anaerotignum propionicum]AMJ42342.1 hypothetical protein CPRO_27980 [Anaerotignum propionicum DSM 1682]SHE99984.1 hypothetical protein SAMN02745151_02454 [[Clostridium] propionicum DSM 1682] [Anaerotignum propionicum DSM 1682]